MRLRIRHGTTYRYRRAVALQPHRLLLAPRDAHELRVLDRSLRITPEASVEWTQDVFGNLVATAEFATPTDRLQISSDVTVEHSAPAWPVFRIAPHAHAFPFRYSPDEIAELGTLLQPQQHDDGALKDWTHAFVHETPTDTLSLLKAINAGIGDTVAYRTRDEVGTQSPSETLAIRSGSCRDMAALFIDTVRGLGFGARAVSGYLHDDELAAGDPGSTHAWAEVYLPGAGWIAFDPTHRRVGSANLVAVAVGRCNGRIMPVSGGYAGSTGDLAGMDVCVNVTALTAEAAR